MSDGATGDGDTVSGASVEAIRYHYDLGNDFYRLWLDPTLTYTCALFDSADEALESAQLRKMDYYLDAARSPRGRGKLDSILDIGCGWGPLLRRAVDHHGVQHAVGVTVSAAQTEYLRGLGDSRIEVCLQPWQEHTSKVPYDAVFSICAIEHFVRPGLARTERVAVYREFFKKVHSLLRPGGTFGLQSICWGSKRPDETVLEGLFFLSTEIFPDSEWPRFAELVRASEGLFEIESVRNDRRHYTRTLKHWRENLRAKRSAAVQVAGEENVARYERYLDFCQVIFGEDYTGLLRFVMRRPG